MEFFKILVTMEYDLTEEQIIDFLTFQEIKGDETHAEHDLKFPKFFDLFREMQLILVHRWSYPNDEILYNFYVSDVGQKLREVLGKGIFI